MQGIDTDEAPFTAVIRSDYRVDDIERLASLPHRRLADHGESVQSSHLFV